MRAGAVLVRLGIEKAAARGKKSIRCAKEMKGWSPAFLLLLTLILLTMALHEVSTMASAARQLAGGGGWHRCSFDPSRPGHCPPPSY